MKSPLGLSCLNYNPEYFARHATSSDTSMLYTILLSLASAILKGSHWAHLPMGGNVKSQFWLSQLGSVTTGS